MAIVMREVERLNGLITDLLDFARPRALEPQRLDLAATLAEMLRGVRERQAPRRARASSWRADERGAASTPTPAQLRQVVWNLLRNAAEAAPRQPIARRGRARDGELASLIACATAGPGIAAEHRARIFEPFFSTKEGGTGLGPGDGAPHRRGAPRRGRDRLSARAAARR